MVYKWGARMEKSLDPDERELTPFRDGRAKRPEVAQQSACVEGVGFENSLKKQQIHTDRMVMEIHFKYTLL